MQSKVYLIFFKKTFNAFKFFLDAVANTNDLIFGISSIAIKDFFTYLQIFSRLNGNLVCD